MNLLFKTFQTCVLHTLAKGTFRDVGKSPHYLFSHQHRTKCKTKINPKSVEGEEESCVAVAIRLCRHHRRKCPLFFSFWFSISTFSLQCTLSNSSRARIQSTVKCVNESTLKHKVKKETHEKTTRIIEVYN